MLLQVLDEGRLTDSHGKTVDFTNTIIIMTSNIGAQHFKSNVDFGLRSEKNKLIKKEIMISVKSKLSPEFINRLDEILFFSKLGKSHISKICQRAGVKLATHKKRARYAPTSSDRHTCSPSIF